jgi:hypothetical protein
MMLMAMSRQGHVSFERAEFKNCMLITAFLAVLFDLDDEDGDQPSVAAEDDAGQPATPHTKAKARAKSKKSKEPPPIGRKAPVPALLTVNLGPSPGAPKPKPQPKSPQESPKSRQVRPGEDKLLELVAANYPSHRAAWRPNGKAWDFFDARRKFADSPDTASVASEESNGACESDISCNLWYLRLTYLYAQGQSGTTLPNSQRRSRSG